METLELHKKRNLLLSQRSIPESFWDELDTYVSPLQRPSNRGGEDPARPEPALWDFTAIDGSTKLAAMIQGGTTPSTIRWSKATFKGIKLENDHEARLYAEGCEDALFKAIEYSGFYVECGSFFEELVDKGHAFLSVEGEWQGDTETPETFQGLKFAAVPCREMLFEEGVDGALKLAFWTRSWKASQIVAFCEKRGWTVPERVQTAHNTTADIRFDFVFAVFERPEILAEKRKGKRGNFIYPAAPERRPYGTRYFLGETGEPIGEEGGVWHMPFHSTQWDRKAGSIWGFGPGHVALPSIKYINGALEMVRAQQHRALVPAFMTTEGNILSDVNVNPGGITYCARPEAMISLPLGNLATADSYIADQRAQIRQLYRTDDLQLKDSPAMTATEVLARVDYMNRMYGSTLARLWEFLSRVLADCMEILERAGLLPDMPDSVRGVGGVYSFEFLGPLARSQRTDEVAALERFANQTMGLREAFPEVRHLLDIHELLRESALKLGIPEKCIRGREQVQQLIREEQQAIARAQQVEEQQRQAQALGQLATIPGALGPAGAGGLAFPGAPELAPTGSPA